MNKILFPRAETAGKPHGAARAASIRPTPALSLRQTRSGAWIVRDANDRCGGLFFTHEAACKFIRSAFDPDAQVITISVTQMRAA